MLLILMLLVSLETGITRSFRCFGIRQAELAVPQDFYSILGLVSTSMSMQRCMAHKGAFPGILLETAVPGDILVNILLTQQ